MFELLRHARLLVLKLIGKIRRILTRIPDKPRMISLGNGIQYQAKYEKFLNKSDFKAILTGSYDLLLQDFLRRELKPGDIFLDVGSNVGYVAAVAASIVAPSGEVHGFEPLKECWPSLLALKAHNPDFKFVLNNFALGQEESKLTIAFDPDQDSRNATLVSGHSAERMYEVPVKRLDNYISETIAEQERIRIIKIDVEGFEFPVLLGLESFLERHQPKIVCEVKPWELARLGHSIQDFEHYMTRFGYSAYDMVSTGKKVDMTASGDLQVFLFKSGS